MHFAPVVSRSGFSSTGMESAHCHHAAPDLSTSPGPAVAGACVSINPTPIPTDTTTSVNALFINVSPLIVTWILRSPGSGPVPVPVTALVSCAECSYCAITHGARSGHDREQPVLNPPVERGKVHARWRADRRTGT